MTNKRKKCEQLYVSAVPDAMIDRKFNDDVKCRKMSRFVAKCRDLSQNVAPGRGIV